MKPLADAETASEDAGDDEEGEESEEEEKPKRAKKAAMKAMKAAPKATSRALAGSDSVDGWRWTSEVEALTADWE